MKIVISLFTLFSILSCTNGVKGKKEDKEVINAIKIPVSETILDDYHKVIKELKMENRIIIQWYQLGKGNKLNTNDIVEIDYKVRLKDSTIVDGNYLVQKESLPFVVGYKMQTLGWDMAFKELKVGDFVKIKLPSNLARGKVGIDQVIPKNAENYITVRILDKKAPTLDLKNTKIWLIHSDSTNGVTFGENKFMLLHCLASTPTNRNFTNSYEKNKPFGVKLSDQGLPKGLKKGLKNRKKGDHIFILVDPIDAYGSKGFGNFVKPNESIFYDIQVLEVQ